jgi:excisionase family DNA binding protein
MNYAVYTTDEVAELLRVHPTTVRRWIASGRVRAIRLPGGNYRLTTEHLADLIQAEGFGPVQPQLPGL